MEINELIDKFGEYNLLAVPYRKPPLGVNTFAMGITHNPEAVRLWPGRTAELSIPGGDPDRKQLILNVKEGARALTQTVKLNGGTGNHDSYSKAPVEAAFVQSFPFGMPVGTKFSVKNIHKTGRRHRHGGSEWAATVEARTSASNESLLVGMDEVAYFAAILPQHATSIETAHRSLRPAGLSKNTLRQGEWFFSPVSKLELEAIRTEIMDHPGRVQTSRRDRFSGHAVGVQLEARSSHRLFGQLIMVPGSGRYVRGRVVDSRTAHHAPLVLEEWHRVVRNTEVIAENTPMRRVTRWD